MMAVLRGILFLLKVLGILLLVVLGLLLLVILLALLAPVRYRGKVQKKEEPEDSFYADAKVTWLNPFLRVRILFSEKKLRYTVRLFGICLLNSEKPKKEKPKKEKQKKEKVKKQRKSDKGKKAKKSSDQPMDKAITVASEESKNTEAPEQTVERPKEEMQAQEVADGGGNSEDSAPEEKKSFLEKIKAFIEKLKALPGKIKEKVVRIRSQIELLWKKKEALFEFLQEEIHILAIGKAMNTLKKMIGHMLPGKIKGSIEFGTGDPESTGKALAGLGILYAAYGKGFTVVPDFAEKRLVADVAFRGRVRFGTLLVVVLRLIRDKQVKAFYKDWKKVVKVLKQKAE